MSDIFSVKMKFPRGNLATLKCIYILLWGKRQCVPQWREWMRILDRRSPSSFSLWYSAEEKEGLYSFHSKMNVSPCEKARREERRITGTERHCRKARSTASLRVFNYNIQIPNEILPIDASLFIRPFVPYRRPPNPPMHIHFQPSRGQGSEGGSFPPGSPPGHLSRRL